MALLEHVDLAARVTIDLASRAEEREEEIGRHLAANCEVDEVVTALEQQFDAFARAEKTGPACSPRTSRFRWASRSAAVRTVPGRLGTARRPRRWRMTALDDSEATTETGGSDATRRLVSLLDLEPLDTDLYRGKQPDTVRQRVYGGQVAAQSLIAGTRTVRPEFHVHSLHSYFLLPGDYNVPIIYDVERIRDGRSFATRRVLARQHGRPIYYQSLNFQVMEEGFEHQEPMPDVKGPEEGRDLVEVMKEQGFEDGIGKELAALDMRWLGSSRYGLDPDPLHPSKAQVWMRIVGRLSDDPVEHLAVFTYASDVLLLGAALAAHDVDPAAVQMATLDHTIWFHRPFRADEWWLYDQWSPSAGGARGLSLGRVFTQDGTLIATTAQEGLIRPRTR